MRPPPLIVTRPTPRAEPSNEGDRAFQDAQALDREGRHDAAVERLRDASRAGHADAMAFLGARLLVGRAAPADPRQALPLIARAAALGQADANALQATLIAADSRAPADFERALDQLARAATAGSQKAQGQLRVLADGTAGADGDWAQMRAGVDVAAWLSPPPRQVLREAPRLRTVEAFASRAVCDWLIARGRPQLKAATVYDLGHGGAQRHDARSNSAAEFDILVADVVVMLLRARIAAATRLPTAAMELPQVLHYAVGQRFERHFDFLDPEMPAYAADLARQGQRIVTFLLYLNDDYEGGATEFPLLDIHHRGRTGDALFFANVDLEHRPDRRTLHAGAAPTAGEKWLLSQWIRDRALPRTA